MSASNDFNAEGEIIALRFQVESLQRQVTAIATALNLLTLTDQTPAEEQLQETTDIIYDWASIENFQ